ncbi:MAG: hypothetical protein PUB96_04300 [Helicobacteraceae bacterium]|nr:hypothetical protein [Helicobacteraceae bacterium]
MFFKKSGGFMLLEFLLLLSFLGIIIISFFKIAETKITASTPQQLQLTTCNKLAESCVFHTNTLSFLPFFTATQLSAKK